MQGTKKGNVFWVMGLPGSGKTTVGTKLYEYLKKKNDATVLFDGDVLRDIYQFKDYSEEGRKKVSKITGRLIKLLTDQGMDVVGCFVSVNKDIRSWNRANLDNLKEIYLKVDVDELIKRDQKGLYSRALKGEIDNVIGINVPFEEPTGVDYIVENYGDCSPDESVKKIIDYFNL